MFQQNKRESQKMWSLRIRQSAEKWKKKENLGWQLLTKSPAQGSSLELIEWGLQKTGVFEENVCEQMNSQISYCLEEVGKSTSEKCGNAGDGVGVGEWETIRNSKKLKTVWKKKDTYVIIVYSEAELCEVFT